jgi:hypothetical protein
VPRLEEAISVLEPYLRADAKPESFLFLSRRGRPFTYMGFFTHFDHAREAAGLAGVSLPHAAHVCYSHGRPEGQQ